VKNKNGRHCGQGSCNCVGRLSTARLLAVQLQAALHTDLNVSSRVGVSHSKILSRLAAVQGALHSCSIITPEEVPDALEYEDVRLLFPGYLGNTLIHHGIQTTADVRKSCSEDLCAAVGYDNAVFVKNSCNGVDGIPIVKRNLWRLLTIECEVREKFTVLLSRLFAQLDNDGRIPLAVKVSVRTVNPVKNTCSKESKTAPIPSGSISPCGRSPSEARAKLLNVVMGLFRRLVDTSRPFRLTLLGLAFVRFHDPSTRMQQPSALSHGVAPRSIASCLLRRREVMSESLITISYEGDENPEGCSREPQLDSMDTLEVDSELTPVEKKARLEILIKTQKHDDMDLGSPSKLRVADLSLADDTAMLQY